MDHPTTSQTRRTRRRVLAAGAGALAAAGLSACGTGSSGAGDAGHERTDDLEILNGALDIERLSIASYDAAIPHLGATDAALARRLREHEHAHVAALSGLVAELGATPATARTSSAVRLPRERSRALARLAAVEDTSIAYYVDALPKLSGPLRHVVLGVVAGEAEHLAVLRMALGLPGSPQAFVWGRP